MRDKIINFSDLDAWKKSHEVVLGVYTLTRKFPREEQFGLTNQIRRAAVSATSNIAEGFGRNGAREKSQFYAIAKGTLLEVQSQLLTARDLAYISDTEYKNLNDSILHAVRLTAGLIRSVISR